MDNQYQFMIKGANEICFGYHCSYILRINLHQFYRTDLCVGNFAEIVCHGPKHPFFSDWRTSRYRKLGNLCDRTSVVPDKKK